MLRIVLLLVFVVAALLLIPKSRRWLLERLKDLSDAFVVLLLRSTSQFGSELTRDGEAEQRMWREQRLRNLQGLALRSKERWGRKKESAE